jgi:hypothetical protein
LIGITANRAMPPVSWRAKKDVDCGDKLRGYDETA